MSSVELNEGALRRLLERPTGAVGRYLELKGARIDLRASEYVQGGGPGPGPQVRTSDLMASVHQVSPRNVGTTLQTDIVADAEHGGIQYGRLQESGGYTPSGTFYRYPFLEPALAKEFNQAFRR